MSRLDDDKIQKIVYTLVLGVSNYGLPSSTMALIDVVARHDKVLAERLMLSVMGWVKGRDLQKSWVKTSQHYDEAVRFLAGLARMLGPQGAIAVYLEALRKYSRLQFSQNRLKSDRARDLARWVDRTVFEQEAEEAEEARP